MAGDWIKLESTTPDKPEVFVIAEHLSIDPDAVIGKLARIWIWADQQTYDGNAGRNAASVTRLLIDRISGVTGFADAMISAGWLEDTSDGLVFPRFGDHNGKTAKQRALTARRAKKHRATNSNADSVTKSAPREEKRRVNTTPPNPPSEGGNSLEELLAESRGIRSGINRADPDGWHRKTSAASEIATKIVGRIGGWGKVLDMDDRDFAREFKNHWKQLFPGRKRRAS